jgi:hypothetical protein
MEKERLRLASGREKSASPIRTLDAFNCRARNVVTPRRADFGLGPR